LLDSETRRFFSPLSEVELNYIYTVCLEAAIENKTVIKIHKNKSRKRDSVTVGDPLNGPVTVDLHGRVNPLQRSVLFDEHGQGYCILDADQKLGEGGFGLVKLGWNINTGEPVAIKIQKLPTEGDRKSRREECLLVETECLEKRGLLYGTKTRVRDQTARYHIGANLNLNLRDSDLDKLRSFLAQTKPKSSPGTNSSSEEILRFNLPKKIKTQLDTIFERANIGELKAGADSYDNAAANTISVELKKHQLHKLFEHNNNLENNSRFSLGDTTLTQFGVTKNVSISVDAYKKLIDYVESIPVVVTDFKKKDLISLYRLKLNSLNKLYRLAKRFLRAGFTIDIPSCKHLLKLEPENLAKSSDSKLLTEINACNSALSKQLEGLLKPKRVSRKNYIVLRYLEGENLAQYCDSVESHLKGGSLEEIIAISLSALKELHSCHLDNIVHKDVKLLNMMLDDGNVTLLDYGISLMVDDVTQQRKYTYKRRDKVLPKIEGTRGFLAPEVKNGYYSAYSDMYAMGKTLRCLYKLIYSVSPEERYIFNNFKTLVKSMLEKEAENRPLPEQAIEQLSIIQENLYLARVSRAIRKNNISDLRKYGKLIDINKLDYRGQSSLLRAISYGNIYLIQELIKFGTDVNMPNKYGITPLNLALVKGNKAVIDLLLANGADNRAFAPMFLTPLELASYMGFNIVDAISLNINSANLMMVQDKATCFDTMYNQDLDLAVGLIKQLNNEMLFERQPSEFKASSGRYRPCCNMPDGDMPKGPSTGNLKTLYQLRDLIIRYSTTDLFCCQGHLNCASLHSYLPADKLDFYRRVSDAVNKEIKIRKNLRF